MAGVITLFYWNIITEYLLHLKIESIRIHSCILPFSPAVLPAIAFLEDKFISELKWYSKFDLEYCPRCLYWETIILVECVCYIPQKLFKGKFSQGMG